MRNDPLRRSRLGLAFIGMLVPMVAAGPAMAGDRGGREPAPESNCIAGTGRTLTPADDGKAVCLLSGQGTRIVIPDPLAPDPVLEGEAIELMPVVQVQASGQREWEIRARRPGRSRIEFRPGYPLTLEIVVGT